jgi:hypothetical protein
VGNEFRGIATHPTSDFTRTTPMDFATLLTALASELHLPPLAADEAGVCILEVGGIPLMLLGSPDDRAVGLLGHVGVVDPTNGSLLENLLGANVEFGGDIRLGVDAGHRILMTHWIALQDLAFGDFMRALEAFANNQEYWLSRLYPAAPVIESARAMSALQNA